MGSGWVIPGPRSWTDFSFAASLALVDEAGYSPPTPYMGEWQR